MARAAPLLADSGLPWGSDDRIPACCVDADAAKADKQSLQKVPLQNVCGPAVLIAWRAFYVMIGIWFATPTVTAYVSTCSADSALADPPTWLLPALFLGVLAELILEHQVRKFMIVPISHWLTTDKPLEVLGFPAPFRVWLAFSTAVSCGVHADVITTGVSVGRTVKQCNPEMSTLWRHLMRNSLVGKLLQLLPFWALTLAAWLLMLCQWILALHQAMPRTKNNIHGAALTYEVNKGHEYTANCGKISQVDAAQVLMETTRMATISGPARTTRIKWTEQVVRYQMPYKLGVTLQRTVLKFAAINVLENATLLNLQAALLGLNKAITGPNGSVDLTLVASILLGVFTGIKNVASEWQCVRQLKANIEETDMREAYRLERWAPSVEHAEKIEELIGGKWTDDELWATVRNQPCVTEFKRRYPNFDDKLIRESCNNLLQVLSEGKMHKEKTPRRHAFFVCCVVLYAALAARAVWVTFMVSLVCKTGLYNIGVGCLELPTHWNETQW